jgi:hypothetical protein
MRKFAIITLCLGLCAAPAVAQETGTEGDEERGLSMMEQGAQMFMEGVMGEMEPALDNLSELADQMRPALRDFAREMGPRLSALLDRVDDWNAYEAPDMLPNGDIIIRRKEDHPLDEPAEPLPDPVDI